VDRLLYLALRFRSGLWTPAMHRSGGYEGASAGDVVSFKQAPLHTSARHTYCTAAVVFSAGWDTVTCNDGIVANQLPKLRPAIRLGGTNLSRTRPELPSRLLPTRPYIGRAMVHACFAEASTSPTSVVRRLAPSRQPNWSGLWLQVVNLSGPGSASSRLFA